MVSWDGANRLFSSYFHSLILASTNDYCGQQLLLWCLANGKLLFPPCILHLSTRFLLLRKSCPISLIYLLFHDLCKSVWTHIFITYQIFYYYYAKIVPDVALRRVFTLVPVSFWHAPVIFDHFLIFWHLCTPHNSSPEYAITPKSLMSLESSRQWSWLRAQLNQRVQLMSLGIPIFLSNFWLCFSQVHS